MRPRSPTLDARTLWTVPWPAICRMARWLGAKVEDGVETPERRAKAVAWCQRTMLATVMGQDKGKTNVRSPMRTDRPP